VAGARIFGQFRWVWVRCRGRSIFTLELVSLCLSKNWGSCLSVFRFLSIVFVVLGLCILPDTAPAQVSVYGSASANSFGFTGDNYPGGPSLKPRATGFNAGAFYMFPSASRFKAGLDGRMTFSSGYAGGKAYTGGVRASFVPHHFFLRPYVQFGGGVASTQLHENICDGLGCGQRTDRVTGGVVQMGGGLDVHINHHFDIRAFDYETDKGGSRGLTSAAVRSYSTGVVYHFSPREPRNR
jgi:hypothetical protein